MTLLLSFTTDNEKNKLQKFCFTFAFFYILVESQLITQNYELMLSLNRLFFKTVID